jgi:parallel beta-helix repeat protein
MKGDFSRLTWDRSKRYDSVRMQQGRVQVDADWNEQVDITTHHREQALADLIGSCCAPDGNAGFGIAASGSDLTISEGRLYVDGILCEQLDSTLTYLSQDDYPDAPLPESSGTFLAYLDVWKWHLTALEDPGIRETALGGRDTTTRLKTVCQVKLQPVASGSECRDVSVDPLSRAGMAARSQPEDDPDSVCVVPATAGYTRLENYLYRIEVHEGGELGVGSPTFKWSRNNATIVTEWLSQQVTNPNRLVVRSTGRDELLGFHDARWVELTDDDRELRGEAGLLVEVVAVEDDVIEIDPGSLTVNIADFTNHPKIRRWDMDTATGAIPIEIAGDNDGYLRIESGVQVLFETGNFRSGDYWLIPARAFIGEFQGDIEWPLDESTGLPAVQAPHGIDHHYCKLALVSFDGTDFSFEDECRHTFHGLCELEAGCCTVVVEPGEDIQAAIDSLPPQGGCVCLKSGDHLIDESIRIDRSNVVLKGESAGARVISDVLPLLTIGVLSPRAGRIDVHGVQFEANAGASGADEPAMIALRSCDEVQIRHCGVRAGAGQVTGITLWDTDRVAILGCHIQVPSNGIWVVEDSLRLRVQDNHIEASQIVTGEDAGLVGVFLDMVFAPCRVIDNRVRGFQVGIALTRDPFAEVSFSGADGSDVYGNHIVRSSMAPADDEDRVFAIDVAAADCWVARNSIWLASSRYGGIRATGARNVVDNNVISSMFPSADAVEQPVAILIGVGDDLAVDDLRVRGNRVDGAQDGIVVRGGSGIVVADNDIGASGNGLRTGILFDSVSDSRAEGNNISNASTAIQLSDGAGNKLFDNDIEGGRAGLLVDQDNRVEIASNRLRTTGEVAIQLISWLGTARVHHNRCESCGHALVGGSAAIAAYLGLGELQIEHCDVRDTGVSPDDGAVVSPAFGVFGLLVIQASLQSNNIGSAVGALTADDGGFTSVQRAVYLLGLMDLHFLDVFSIGFPAQLLGNRFSGIGNQPVVEVAGFRINDNFSMRFNRVQYSDNFCWHVNTPVEGSASVLITSSSASAMGNHFKSLMFIHPIDFGSTSALYMGNAARGADALGSSILPTPQDSFNR